MFRPGLLLPGLLCLALSGLTLACEEQPAGTQAVTQAVDAGRHAAGSSAGDVDAACTPAFDTGIDDEPWKGARRQRSERTFRARMKREHPYYVSGKDGWKFFTDVHDENFSQAVGRVTLSARQRAAWARWIRASRRTVEAQGGHYFVVVAPATGTSTRTGCRRGHGGCAARRRCRR